MKLFTKDIDQKLFDQYMMGNDLENQMVVAKIFNPYGNGVWYLLNSDPTDPDYLWAIVDLFDVELGSVSREELETLKVPPFRLGLERDLYFTPMNAKNLYDSLLKGEKFEDGGTIDIKKDKSGESWVFPNNPQGETYGIKLAAGGMTAGRYYRDNSGQEFRYIGESQGKLLFKDGEKVVYKDESEFKEAPEEKKRFSFFKDGGNIKNKRYTVNIYYGGEMEDEEFYADSLDEAERLSQGGEHSEIYDNHKKELVEKEFAKGGNTEIYEVELSAESNPDFEKSSHEGSVNIKSHKVKAKSIENARNVVISFIMENDLGGGNWSGGNVYKNGKKIGHVSYNGRYWDDTKMAKGGMVEHGFNKGDKILEIYKGHGIVENSSGIIEVINPEYGTRFIIDLDETRPTGKKSMNMPIDKQLKSAKEYIDYVSEDKMAKGGVIKYQGKEGKIINKKNGMYFVEVKNYYPNGDSLHSVLRDGEFEKMADGGKLSNGKYKYEKGDEGMFQGDEVRVVKYTTSFGGSYEYNIIDENGKVKTHGVAKAEKFENQFRFFPKMAKGGGVGFTAYGETKGIYKVYYKAEGKPQTEIWETKEMAVNIAKRYSSPQMAEEFSNVKVFDEDGAEVDYMSETKYEDGGEMDDEMVDLFEDYDDIPENVQKVLDKHSDAFENEDYKGLETAKKDLEKIGYTFEYGLDGTAYDLRKIGQKGRSGEEYAKGGMTKFKEKVQSIKASLLKRKKVSPKVQKDYGKTYSPKEAEESAKRIAGSMVKKEKRQPRVSKMLEKMKKGTQLNKKKSTFKDRMKELSTKIKERKSKSTK